MDRNQGVIHLGKSKSPENFKRVICFSDNQGVQIRPVSRDKIHHDQLMMNQSVRVSAGFPFAHQQINQLAKTHHSLTYQNCKQNIPTQNQLSLKNNQVQLLQRIKILETRCQQLHHQKQSCLMKAHEQNKRIVLENNQLRQKLFEMQKVKNNYMVYVREEISRLGGATPNFGQKEQVQKREVVQEQDDYHSNMEMSIDRHMKIEDQGLELENKMLKQKLYQLEQEKKMYLNIEEQNRKYREIHNKLQMKIKYLEQNFHGQPSNLNNIKLAADLQDSKNQVQFYVQKLLQKSQQLMHTQQAYKQKLQKLTKQKEQLQKRLQKSSSSNNSTGHSRIESKFAQQTSKMSPYLQTNQQTHSIMKTLMKLNQKAYTDPGSI